MIILGRDVESSNRTRSNRRDSAIIVSKSTDKPEKMELSDVLRLIIVRFAFVAFTLAAYAGS